MEAGSNPRRTRGRGGGSERERTVWEAGHSPVEQQSVTLPGPGSQVVARALGEARVLTARGRQLGEHLGAGTGGQHGC